MGLEEVSELNDSSVSACNLELCKPNMKDASASGKESSIKINGKKRIFALLMCAMMAVSSMSVCAGYGSKTIGATAEDLATCELYMYSYSGTAYTTPASTANTVRTTLTAYNSGGAELDDAVGTYNASVSTSLPAAKGISYHQAGPYSASLTVKP